MRCYVSRKGTQAKIEAQTATVTIGLTLPCGYSWMLIFQALEWGSPAARIPCRFPVLVRESGSDDKPATGKESAADNPVDWMMNFNALTIGI